MQKKKKKILVATALLVTLSILIALFITDESFNVLVLDALLGNKTYLGYDPYNKPAKPSEVPELSDDVFSEYDAMAQVIDLTQLPDFDKEILDKIPKGAYTGTSNSNFSLKSEIQQYQLITEILTRDDINPSGEVTITPSMIYGSWFCEYGLGPKESDAFDVYNDLTINDASKLYIGPLSFSRSYLTPVAIPETGARMYAYISKNENATLDDASRVLRIGLGELQGSQPLNTNRKTITDGTHSIPMESKNEYITKFKTSVTKFPASRPSPLYMPDVFYTFCRKLRSTYEGKDIYTLNKLNTNESEFIDSAYEDLLRRFPKIGTETDFKSQLYYLYAIHLNSSKFDPHYYSKNGTTTGIQLAPTSANDYAGTMPLIYFEMLAQYSTLNLGSIVPDASSYSSVTGNNGWSFVTGRTSKAIQDTKITYEGNLIDKLDKKPSAERYYTDANNPTTTLRTAFDNATQSTDSWEIAQCLVYPLRCLTIGDFIQRGVESMIKSTYDYQVENGIIKTIQEEPDEEDSDIIYASKAHYRTSPGTIDGLQLLPNSLFVDIENANPVHPICVGGNLNTTVSHGYWCGSKDNLFDWENCKPWHRNQHKAVDMHVARKGKPEILSLLDGEVTIAQKSSSKTDNSGRGNNVAIKHILIQADGTEVILYTRYSHMAPNSLAVKKGDIVKAGQKLGIMGTTGNSSGDHLHFDLYTMKGSTLIKYDYTLLIENARKVALQECSVVKK